MKITVLGTGCSGCKALYQTTLQAVEELAITATVVKQEDMAQIMAYNVMQLPGLVIDKKVVCQGKKLSLGELKALLSSYVEAHCQ